MLRDRGYARLGYASPQQYASEHLGMSLRAVTDRRLAARAAATMPAIGEAVRARRLGFSVALFLARVAKPATAARWVRRAEQRTVKHLVEEIRAADLLGIDAPPTPKQLATVVGLERAVDGYVDPAAPARPRQKFGIPNAPTARFRLPTRRTHHDHWCALERCYAEWGKPYGDFPDFVFAVVWNAYPIDPTYEPEYLDVAQRDRGCSSPVCSDRDCGCHHVRPRSKGGGEERENLAGIGYVCHMILIHVLASLQVTGRAPDGLEWLIGPPDIGLRVKGRRLLRRR